MGAGGGGVTHDSDSYTLYVGYVNLTIADMSEATEENPGAFTAERPSRPRVPLKLEFSFEDPNYNPTSDNGTLTLSSQCGSCATLWDLSLGGAQISLPMSASGANLPRNLSYTAYVQGKPETDGNGLFTLSFWGGGCSGGDSCKITVSRLDIATSLSNNPFSPLSDPEYVPGTPNEDDPGIFIPKGSSRYMQILYQHGEDPVPAPLPGDVARFEGVETPTPAHVSLMWLDPPQPPPQSFPLPWLPPMNSLPSNGVCQATFEVTGESVGADTIRWRMPVPNASPVEDTVKLTVVDLDLPATKFMALGETYPCSASLLPAGSGVSGVYTWTHDPSGRVRFSVGGQECDTVTGPNATAVTIVAKAVSSAPEDAWVKCDFVSNSPPGAQIALSDTMNCTVLDMDLDINTHDHPRDVVGIPTVSSVGNMDAADEPREENPGGYLWCNDDNDRNTGTGDAIIDLNDVSTPYYDNDLEPILCSFSPAVWPSCCTVEVVVSDASGIRIWHNNSDVNPSVNGKGVPLAPGLYSWASVLPGDPVLFLEGLRSGAYDITFRLKTPDQSEVIKEDKIKATVFGVGNVQWQAYDATGISTIIDNTPGPAPTGQTRTGVRIFPDKRVVGDTQDHDKPKLVTTLTPSIPAGSGWNVRLFAKVFDVDHYSAGNIEGNLLDANEASEGNVFTGYLEGYAPNDNRTGYSTYDEQGRFGQGGDAYDLGIEILDVPGDAVVHFVNNVSNGKQTDAYWYERISESVPGEAILHLRHHTPGNNWRVAVSCAGTDVFTAARINNAAQDGQTLEYINDTALGVESAGATASRCTEILTVWRRLFIEQDHMADPTWDNFYQGWASEQTIQNNDVTFAASPTLATQFSATLVNQYENGLVHFWDMNMFGTDYFLGAGTIVSNTAGSNISVTFNAAPPAGTDYAYITDDDIHVLATYPGQAATPHINPAEPDLALFNDPNMFPAACIWCVDTLLNTYDTTNVAFTLNVTDQDDTVGTNKGIRGGELLWVATVLDAYQYGVDASYDPNGGAGTRGISSPFWITNIPDAAVGGCISFSETIRDWATNTTPPPPMQFTLVHRRVPVHEVGHLLGGQHFTIRPLGDLQNWQPGDPDPVAGEREGGIMDSELNWNSITHAVEWLSGVERSTDVFFSGRSLRKSMLLRDQGPGNP